MHINAVGGDCPGKTELHRRRAAHAARVIVEYEPQTRVEGDIQQLPADFAVTELWRVLQGSAAGPRAMRRQVTVFDSVGFALEDFSRCAGCATARSNWGLAPAAHLVPELDDPKDLFALLSAPMAHRAAPAASAARQRCSRPETS